MDLVQNDLTQDELREAFLRVMANGDDLSDDLPVLWDDIVRCARAYREPVWEIGDIVRSVDGLFWQRYTSCQWRKMGSTGAFPHKQPKRPLTLLDSPEGRKRQERDRLRRLERARDFGAPV